LAAQIAQFPKTLDEKSIAPLRQVCESIDCAADEYAKEGRKLRIGIVGQVKVGKSSFLNALLFDGRDLLPKAATPMTAALTTLSYADEPCAEVEFFTHDDWGKVERLSSEYEAVRDRLAGERERKRPRHPRGKTTGGRSGVPDGGANEHCARPEVRDAVLESMVRDEVGEECGAAHELVSQVRARGLDVNTYLGTREALKGKDDASLMEGLEQYVGANGRYTPFTRNTHIHLNMPVLRDIEVVDTPGTNDPIISRGHITREFLKRCDCVLLLCYSGQFMGEEDVAFLLRSLPNQGVSRVLLVGTKFDSVLLDEARKYRGDLKAAVCDIVRKLEAQAYDTLLPEIDAEPSNPTYQAVRGCLPPRFVSALCYSAGRRGHGSHLTELETKVIGLLAKHFQDFDFTPERLLELANIDRIRDRDLKKLLEDKEAIQARRLGDLMRGQLGEANRHLADMRHRVERQLGRIRNEDISEIEESTTRAEKALSRCGGQVTLAFAEFSRAVSEGLLRLCEEFEAAARNAQRVDVHERDEAIGTERYGFLWLRKRTVYGTVRYAEVHEAVERLCDFVGETKTKASAAWREILNPAKLKDALVDLVDGCFDLTDESVDDEGVEIHVRRTANELIMPRFDLDGDKYEKMIESRFSALTTVRNHEADELVKLQRKLVKEVLGDAKRIIDEITPAVRSSLESQGKRFLENVTQGLQEEAEQLKEQLQNRRYAEQQCEELLGMLDGAVEYLQKAGESSQG
jgi:hypothetical protein